MFCFYSGTPLIRSPIGQKILAVLTGDRINEAKKSGRNNEVAVRRGFTVLASARVKDAFISENLNWDSKIQTWILSFFTDPRMDFAFLY